MEDWIPIIIFIGVPVAIVAAVVYALVRIRKRREKDNAQVSRAGDGVDPKVKKLFKAASKRNFSRPITIPYAKDSLLVDNTSSDLII